MRLTPLILLMLLKALPAWAGPDLKVFMGTYQKEESSTDARCPASVSLADLLPEGQSRPPVIIPPRQPKIKGCQEIQEREVVNSRERILAQGRDPSSADPHWQVIHTFSKVCNGEKTFHGFHIWNLIKASSNSAVLQFKNAYGKEFYCTYKQNTSREK